MTRSTLIRAAAATVAAFLVMSPAAHAADSLSIDDATTDGSTINAVVSIDGLTDGQSVDTGSATMTFGSVTFDATATSVNKVSDYRQVALLTMDTSGSMAGSGIAGAKQAASAFLDAVPPSVEVGLVTFANKAQVAVAPTTDRAAVQKAIDGLTANGSTALYDAVTLSAKEIAAADLGTVLILSDGANEGSSATLAQATKSAKASGATFDAVSIGTALSQVAPLRAITKATGGTVTTTTTNAASLTAAFDKTAQGISNKYVVSGNVPDNVTATAGNVTVSLTVDGSALSDTTFVQLNGAAAPVDASSIKPQVVAAPGVLQRAAGNALWLALVALFVGLAALIYFAITAARSRETADSKRMSRRLSVYTLTSKAPVKEQESTALGDSQVARSAVEFAGRMVARRDFETVMGEQLESAGIPLKTAEWLLIQVGIGIGAGLLFFFVFGGALVPTLIGLALGLAAPWLYLSRKRSSRFKKFMAQMPDTLQLMAGSLAAGYSLPQSVDTVVRDGEPPMSSEFNRALIETRLGVPLEDALDGIAARMRSKDFSWVVMAIRIQREVGGNLAEVLTTVAATLRERERLRRQVDVLSAEGRLSAWILALLPITFAAYLAIARPSYLAPLVTTPMGFVLIGLGLILLTVGILWMRKVVKVEV
ncbi:MAG: type II secretion system F family protein [Actinomycetes bacterium]